MMRGPDSQSNRGPFARSPGVRVGERSCSRIPKTRTCIEAATNTAEPVLLERARGGNGAAFGELSDRCRASLMRTARRIVRDEADAEDCVQDSLVNAFVNLRGFDGRSTFLTWATRIAINCCLMRLRDRRRHREKRLESEITEDVYAEVECTRLNPEQSLARSVEERQLHLAIASLPEKLRIAIETKELQDRTLREAAALLGISAAATKGRLFRAKELLKRRLSSKRRNPALACFSTHRHLPAAFPASSSRGRRISHGVSTQPVVLLSGERIFAMGLFDGAGEVADGKTSCEQVHA